MKCDTCGKKTKEVKRVIIYKGYNRTQAVPIFNCSKCYNKKEKSKTYNKNGQKRKK